MKIYDTLIPSKNNSKDSKILRSFQADSPQSLLITHYFNKQGRMGRQYSY